MDRASRGGGGWSGRARGSRGARRVGGDAARDARGRPQICGRARQLGRAAPHLCVELCGTSWLRHARRQRVPRPPGRAPRKGAAPRAHAGARAGRRPSGRGVRGRRTEHRRWLSDYATHRNSAPGQEGADEARGATDSGEEEEDAPAATFLSPLCAQPTAAHRVLAGLVRESFVQRILQQNHDGLPQKAGVPQQHINEIHGALHAPDNPVVHMSGALRNELYADMPRCEDDADVVIAVGTTLAGMNADRVVHSAARRAGLGRSQGAIIIGLQRTQHDQDATLRIFGRTDRVFRLLAQELGISASVTARRKHGGFFLAPVLAEARRALQQQRDAKRDPLPQRPVAELQVLYDEPDSHAGGPIDADEHAEYVVTNVPYDSIGQRSHSEAGALDLRKGSKLLIPSGPRAGAVGKVTGYDREGNPRCQFHLRLKPQPGSFKAPMESVLGTWWIQAASDGAVQQLPVVNVPAAEAQGEAAQAARKLMEAYAV